MRDFSVDSSTLSSRKLSDRIALIRRTLPEIYKRLRFKQIEIWTVQDGPAGEIDVGGKGPSRSSVSVRPCTKMKRGQAGVIRDGRHNGGRSTGIVRCQAKPASLEIHEDEAALVRRIFDSYANGSVTARHRCRTQSRGNPRATGRRMEASTIGVAESEPTMSCKLHCMSAALRGIANASSRTRKLARRVSRRGPSIRNG